MRFKPGLVLKICSVLTALFMFIIFFKDSGDSTAGGEYLSHGQKRQLKNDSKVINEISQTQTQKSPESLDLADESDSLAGKRIDGLPNVTETRRLVVSCVYVCNILHSNLVTLFVTSSNINNYSAPQ